MELQEAVIKNGGSIYTETGEEVVSVSAAGVPTIKANIQDSLASGKIYVGDSNGVTSEATVSGDATLSNTGVLTIADEAVTPAKQGVGTLSTATVSSVNVAIIPSATIKALLDTNTNDLWEAPANTFISDVTIRNFDAAGSAGTIDIGVDASWLNGGAVVDAFIDGHDANSGGASTRMILLDTASQAALASGIGTTTGGSVTIDSSADLSASSWTGQIEITYSVIA